MAPDQVARQSSKEVDAWTAESNALLAGLFRAHRESVVRVCRRALGRFGTPADADELVQEAFLRLARKPDLHAVEDPKAFLFKTVVNLAKTRKRDQFNRAELLHVYISTVPEAELVSVDVSPDRVAQGKQDFAALCDSLSQLTPKCQAVFALRMFEGLSYKQIAEELGISTRAVDKQLRRAIAHMTARLTDEDDRVAALRQP